MSHGIYVASFYLRGYMLQDVAECRISNRGHCDLALNCHGKIEEIISGMFRFSLS